MEAEANRRRERAASASANTVSTPAATGDYTTGSAGAEAGNALVLDENGKIPQRYLYPPTAGSVARSYEHVQTLPSKTWTIVHSLGGFPPPVVIAADGSELNPSVRYPDDQTVILEFGRNAHAGRCRLSL